ncbi:hypothetical protein OIU76_028554 [Salix suchowensis]|nr:hypothetical protein OIU76_028554 [Salix suchowensis]
MVAAGERVDLPFLSPLLAVAFNDYLQNKPKSTNTKSIDSPLLQISAHVLLFQGWWVALPWKGLCCRRWLVAATRRWVCKRGPLGEKGNGCAAESGGE